MSVIPDPATTDWVPLGYGTSVITPLVTAFPATPFDGQEVILVDSLTNPLYQWRMRYNAARTGSFKWEFVGGQPAYVADMAGVQRQNTIVATWQWITGMPSLTLPRAGQYIYRFGAWILTTNFGNSVYVSVGTALLASTGIMNANVQRYRGGTGGNNDIMAGTWTADDRSMGTSRAAGVVIGTIMYSSPIGDVAVYYPWLEVIPMCLS